MPSKFALRVTAAVAAVLLALGVVVVAGGVFGADTLARRLFDRQGAPAPLGPDDEPTATPQATPPLLPKQPTPRALPLSPALKPSPSASASASANPRPTPTPPPPNPDVPPGGGVEPGIPLSGNPTTESRLRLVPLPPRTGGMLRISVEDGRTRVVIRDSEGRTVFDEVLGKGARGWVRYGDITVLSPTPERVRLSVSNKSEG